MSSAPTVDELMEEMLKQPIVTPPCEELESIGLDPMYTDLLRIIHTNNLDAIISVTKIKGGNLEHKSALVRELLDQNMQIITYLTQGE